MKKYTNRGFTLIELLVVIAIIGILSSIVLASLNTARSKGGDAAVKGNLSGIRAQAEIEYDGKGCYTGSTACSGTTAPTAIAPAACANPATHIFGQTTIAAAITAAKAAGGLNACSSNAGGSAWAVVTQYKSDGLKGWCVDSTGKSKEVTIATNDQAGVTAEVNVSGACVE